MALNGVKCYKNKKKVDILLSTQRPLICLQKYDIYRVSIWALLATQRSQLCLQKFDIKGVSMRGLGVARSGMRSVTKEYGGGGIVINSAASNVPQKIWDIMAINKAFQAFIFSIRDFWPLGSPLPPPTLTLIPTVSQFFGGILEAAYLTIFYGFEKWQIKKWRHIRGRSIDLILLLTELDMNGP